MPPRKKIVKRSTPARRPSTRRSVAAAAAAEVEAVVPETEVDIPVAVTVSAHVSGGKKESDGGSLLAEGVPVAKREEREKDGGADVTNASVVADEEGTALVRSPDVGVEENEKEKDAVVVGTPVVMCEGKEKESGASSIKTQVSVDQKSEAAALVSPEIQTKDDVFVGTLVATSEEKNTSFFETPASVDQKSEAAVVGSHKGQKEKKIPFIETPVSVDQKSEAALLGSPDSQTHCPPQETVIEDPMGMSPPLNEGVDAAGSGGKPDGSKKTVKIVKKITRRVVVKKKPKTVNKEEEKGVETVTIEGEVRIDNKEHKPASSIDVMMWGGEVGIDVDKECKPMNRSIQEETMATGIVRIDDKECKLASSTDAMVLGGEVGIVAGEECKPVNDSDNFTVDGVSVIEEDKDHKTKSSMDALNIEEGLVVDEDKVCKPMAMSTLTGDDSNAEVKKPDSFDGTSNQNGEALCCESEDATCAASSTGAPIEQELKTDVEELPLIDDGDVRNVVVENNEKGEDAPSNACVGVEEAAISERQRKRKAEIFIGGLSRDAKEEDIRKVFGKIGEIVEVRLLMDAKTGKNKGYAFLRYATEALAKQAVSEFGKVEVCGKLCGTATLEENDAIRLDHIDRKWKKEDIIRLLQEIGIEKIDTVTVVSDLNNGDVNRGFAFLELETNRDAQIAFKKLQKKDAFGKGRNIRISWSTPNDSNEDIMQKVKSVFVEAVPSSWEEDNVRECFKKFGEIERVVLARNIPTSKRKDYAFVNYTKREAALLCIESLEKDEIFENGSKVNLRVSLAKPSQKGKGSKDMPRDKQKAVQKDPRESTFSKAKSFKLGYGSTAGDTFPFTEHATWRQGYMAYNRGFPARDHPFVVHGEKRPYSSLGGPAAHPDPRGYPRARIDGPFTTASPSAMPSNIHGPPYYPQPNVGYGPGTYYGATNPSSGFQARYGNAPPYESHRYPRY